MDYQAAHLSSINTINSTPMKEKNILGLDLGTNSIGWALVSGQASDEGEVRVSGKTRLVRVPPRRQQKRKARSSMSGILCSFAS